jgi:ferredoxin-nitrate reductase
MSNREAGADGSYPGYRNPHNEKHMRELCELWNIDFGQFHPEVPKDILLLMETAERGQRMQVYQQAGARAGKQPT